MNIIISRKNRREIKRRRGNKESAGTKRTQMNMAKNNDFK
jgi:hypothetical protein